MCVPSDPGEGKWIREMRAEAGEVNQRGWRKLFQILIQALGLTSYSVVGTVSGQPGVPVDCT
jgi:hypothetical protein